MQTYQQTYCGQQLDRIAFPLGGIGAGMVCLNGNGGLSHVSVRNRPDLKNEPCVFAALAMRGAQACARVLEGPVPIWKVLDSPGSATGIPGSSFGLPRFDSAEFSARFPCAQVKLTDAEVPLTVGITAWSPFTPGESDSSCLPVAALEYQFTNPTDIEQEAVFSFNARNFMRMSPAHPAAIRAFQDGFELWGGGTEDSPWDEGSFAVAVGHPNIKIDHAWFRGVWYDPLSIAWKHIANGEVIAKPPVESGEPASGASIYAPFTLAPGQSTTIIVRLCWFVGRTNQRYCTQGHPGYEKDQADLASGTYRPWYAGRFSDIHALGAEWSGRYSELREKSFRFSECFYDSTLPPEVVEAVGSNLAILKSPTILRQDDGKIWAWEGSGMEEGSCPGSCTHVWNYAHALAHLFPDLERTLRETEFGPNQDASGHQQFRAALPIRPVGAHFHAAADGQLGGILKIYRDWRISGDTAWLKNIWPQVRQSLEYCIHTWDPERKGWLEEPHHNTYDIEFWGPNGMMASFYLGALQAAVVMGKSLQEDVADFEGLLLGGKERVRAELFNGEFFVQKTQWVGLRAKDPVSFQSLVGEYSPEAREMLEKEGPKYQYGDGCLSDGVIGEWMARACGLGEVLDPEQVIGHVRAVYRYNLRKDLRRHSNPQRPGFALGTEGGLLLCTWPRGGKPSLPFVYSDEVWTGIEYQVAAHLAFVGLPEEALDIVRTCRARYDGIVRNPFCEYECGHWYGRALASYSLLQAFSGVRYDAVDSIVYIDRPALKGDFRCFLATATGYGTVGISKGKPFVEVRSGSIPYKRIEYNRVAADREIRAT